MTRWWNSDVRARPESKTQKVALTGDGEEGGRQLLSSQQNEGTGHDCQDGQYGTRIQRPQVNEGSRPGGNQPDCQQQHALILRSRDPFHAEFLPTACRMCTSRAKKRGSAVKA